jgi:hypothetical protein
MLLNSILLCIEKMDELNQLHPLRTRLLLYVPNGDIPEQKVLPAHDKKYSMTVKT